MLRNKLKAKTKHSSNTDKVQQHDTKAPKHKKSFKEWFKSNKKKILLASYYAGAIIVIASSIYVIMSNITKTEDVIRDEPISFFTEYIEDDSLELGTEEVEREGEDGIKKVTYKEESYLLSGEVISSLQIDFERTKEPINKIVRRGTRKWQYMVCSDGSWRYYTDEQFKDKNVGFTHASEDSCAKNGQGVAVALADTPPSSNSTVSPYLDNGGSGLTDEYVRAMEIIAEREQEQRNNYVNSTSPTEPFVSSIDYNPFAGWEARQEAEKQARAAAESHCRVRANAAGRGARAQMGAMGQSSEYIDFVVDQAIDSVYLDCMHSYGY